MGRTQMRSSGGLHTVFRKQIIVQDLSGDSLPVVFAANLSTAVSPLVVDPRYARDYNQGVRSVANGTPSFLRAAFPLAASINAVP